MSPPREVAELRTILHRIDGASYGRYRQLLGRYRLGEFELSIDRVPPDPFAGSARMRLVVTRDGCGLPADLVDNPVRRLGIEDYVGAEAADAVSAGLSGKGREGPGLGRIRLVAGVEDAAEGQPDLERALSDVPESMPLLLLSHTPAIFDRAPVREPDLTLVGHTHGGQVRIPLILPIFMRLKGYPSQRPGLSRREGGDLYVSRGIGTTGPAVRFRCPPEITIVGGGGQRHGVSQSAHSRDGRR